LIPAARLAILRAGQGSDFDCAPDQGSGFKVQQSQGRPPANKKTTLKDRFPRRGIDLTPEEEAHETS
jgi:hypothetical protein